MGADRAGNVFRVMPGYGLKSAPGMTTRERRRASREKHSAPGWDAAKARYFADLYELF